MTANRAPRPPSRSRPFCDSLMKDDRSWTTATVSVPAWRVPASFSDASTASATCTVFAPELFVTVSVSAGLPLVRA